MPLAFGARRLAARWKLGLQLMALFGVVAVLFVPVFWRSRLGESMRDGIEYHLWRQPLPGGVTTVYAVRAQPRSTRARIVFAHKPEHLDVWCRPRRRRGGARWAGLGSADPVGDLLQAGPLLSPAGE